MLGIVAKSP